MCTNYGLIIYVVAGVDIDFAMGVEAREVNVHVVDPHLDTINQGIFHSDFLICAEFSLLDMDRMRKTSCFCHLY